MTEYEINLEIKDNFKKVEKDIDDLNKSLKDTGKEFDKAATFAERYGDELQPLTTRMGEAEDRLYELAAAGDTASKEYRDLLQTVGEYRKVQIQTDMAVDAAATTLGQKLGGALGGVTSGFSLAQGAMALFGSENEALEESLLKVQSALAIQQGIQGIREAIPSFKSLATVAVNTFSSMTTASKLFAVTGIGALITAVAYLMGAFDNTKKSVENYASAQQTSNKIQQQAIEDSAKELSALNKLQKQINDETLTREEKNKAVKKLQDTYPDLLKNIDAEKLSINDLNKAVALNIKLAESRARVNAAEALRASKYQEILTKEIEVQKKLAEIEEIRKIKSRNAIEIEDNKERINNITRSLKRTQDRIALAKEEIKQIDGITKADEALIAQVEKQTKVYETETPKVIKEVKKLANYSLQVEKEKIDAMEDGMEKRLALLTFEEKQELAQIDKKGKNAGELTTAIETRYEKERNKIKEEFYEAQRKAQEEAQKLANSNQIRLQREFDDVIEALAEQNFQNTLTEEQREIQAVNDKYFELQTLAAGNAEQLAIIEQAKADELGAIEKKANEKSIEEAKAVAEQKAAIQQQGLDTALQGVQLIKGLFEKSKGVQKAAVIAESAIGIAKMIISNKLANAGALATPQAIATSGAAAAPVIALNNISTGIGIAANIAATAKALKSLGGGSAPSAPADGGGGGGGGASTTPQFNTIGSSGVNQLAQLQQQPVQAYVVSGDVTSAQSLDRNRIQNATL
jgi:hypothetical protein